MALEFLPSDDTERLAEVRISMSVLAWQRGLTDDAVIHALAARGLCPARALPALLLGDRCRERRQFADAATWYREAGVLARQAEPPGGGAKSDTDAIDRLDQTLLLRGEVLAYVHVGLAELCLDRLVNVLKRARWRAERGAT